MCSGAEAVATFECGGEAEWAGVANLLGHHCDGVVGVGEKVHGEGHTPSREIRHYRFADELGEASSQVRSTGPDSMGE